MSKNNDSATFEFVMVCVPVVITVMWETESIKPITKNKNFPPFLQQMSYKCEYLMSECFSKMACFNYQKQELK